MGGNAISSSSFTEKCDTGAGYKLGTENQQFTGLRNTDIQAHKQLDKQYESQQDNVKLAENVGCGRE